MKKVLVIVAHPDDEVLGCGGTIACHREENDEVHIVLMADGVTSRTYHPEKKQSRAEELEFNKEAIIQRRNEAYKANEILGVEQKNIHFLNFPDQRLDSLPLLDLIKGIEEVKSRIHPDVIYTHFLDDLNLDHCLTARAALTAFRPVFGVQTFPIYHFEVPETTSLSTSHEADAFQPNHFVDISKTLEKKLQALQTYESEKREYPDLRSAQYIKEHARKRSEGTGSEYAEAFYFSKILKISID